MDAQHHPEQASSAPRIGTDLVYVPDINEAVSCFGNRYLQRIFTARELADSSDDGAPPDTQRLAARFAAKEAVVKVLRPVRHWFNWRDLEIVRDPGGWVALELHGAAQAHAKSQGLNHFNLSLSHERDYAIAVVVGSA